MPEQQWFSISEFGKLAGISPATVRRWLREGLLHGVQTKPGTGHWRIPLSELERLQKETEQRMTRLRQGLPTNLGRHDG
jgi:excisionase family DNA binding protein